MSIREEARQEARRRWPGIGRGEQSARDDRTRVVGFEEGAVWRDEQADREPSDEEVEAGCVAFYEGARGITSWGRLKAADPDLANRYRDGIRAALEAALGKTRETEQADQRSPAQ